MFMIFLRIRKSCGILKINNQKTLKYSLENNLYFIFYFLNVNPYEENIEKKVFC